MGQSIPLSLLMGWQVVPRVPESSVNFKNDCFQSIIYDTGGTSNQRGMSSSCMRQLVVLLVLTSIFIQLNM